MLSQITTHFPIIDHTNEFMIQETEDLIWLMVIPRPACATFSWYHCIINSVILKDFGNNAGCWILSDMPHFPILPQTFNIPSWSKNGSKFTILDYDFREFLLFNAIISSLKCVCWTDSITSFSALFSSSVLNRLLLQLMLSAPFVPFLLLMRWSNFIL